MVVKKSRVLAWAGAIVATAATIGLSVPVAQSQTGTEIQIDGSSTVFPVTEAVAEEYMSGNSVNVSVGVSGSGGGFRRFCAGETAISNASRSMKEEEIATCRENGIQFIELPIGLDALTVVVNPANDWVDTLTVEQLNRIWAPESQGTVDSWNDVDSSFPDVPLVLYGPGTDSGTFDYFTDVINGEEGASRADYTASEDDNILVRGVADSSTPGALGYFGLAYYLENQDDLTSVSIVNPNTGEAVAPSVEAAASGDYAPLARPLFIYVSVNAMEENPEVRNFVEYYLGRGDLVAEVGYVPYSREEYATIREHFRSGNTGSIYSAGHDLGGLSLSDVFDLEPIE